MIQLKSREQQSYAPGVCDAGDGPSGDMPANIAIESAQSNDTSDFRENCFVIIPFRPPSKWFAARVVEVNDKDKKIKLDWLHTDNGIDFNHKEPGDRGYEKPSYEYMNNVLCAIPPPDTVCTLRRTKMIIPSDIIAEVNKKYCKWKDDMNY